MKKTHLIFLMLVLLGSGVSAQMGVNADGTLPDGSAGVDVNFTDRGFLPSRVALSSTTSASPVTAPAEGLLVYNTATAGTYPNNVSAGYYYWNGTKWVSLSTMDGTAAGNMRYWDGSNWVMIPAGASGQSLSIRNGHPVWANTPFACGTTLTINHVAGAVAPVTKTVTYGTYAGTPGVQGVCWITKNLGATQQATAISDATEASAGWYWQFNRKQGYKHDGSTRTPNTTWITMIFENYNWSADNDPCALELGAGWRIPSSAEWTNLDAAQGWTTSAGPWSSAIKLHPAGCLYYDTGNLTARGSEGYYWSSTDYAGGWGYRLYFDTQRSYVSDEIKSTAASVRCVREY